MRMGSARAYSCFFSTVRVTIISNVNGIADSLALSVRRHLANVTHFFHVLRQSCPVTTVSTDDASTCVKGMDNSDGPLSARI